MENWKKRLEKLDKWDVRGADRIIGEELRKDKADKQYRKFNQDAKNRSMMIRNYKNVFDIDVVPHTRGIV